MSKMQPDPGQILTSFPEVMHKILSYLNMKQLNSLARVCKSWCEEIQRLKKKRLTPLWFYLNLEKARSDSIEYDCESDLLNSAFDNSWSEPSFGVVFYTNDLHHSGFEFVKDSPVRKSKRYKKDMLPVVPEITKRLPHPCTLLGVVAAGVIGTDSQFICEEMEEASAISGWFLPNNPSLRHYYFTLSGNQCISVDGMSKDELHRLMRIPKDAGDIKLLLFFATSHDHGALDVPMNLYRQYDRKIAIAGGFVDSIEDSTLADATSETSFLGIAFCGDNLHVVETIVGYHISTEKEVKQEMEKLKSIAGDCSSSARSVGFQFSCVARGSQFYGGSENVECQIFRSMFPQTPLLGFFGNGEIGHKYPPDEESPPSKTERPSLFHGYSSVFVVMSW